MNWQNTEIDVIKTYKNEQGCSMGSFYLCTLRINKKSKAHGTLTEDKEIIEYYNNSIRYIFNRFQKNTPDTDSEFADYIKKYHSDIFKVVKQTNKTTVCV